MGVKSKGGVRLISLPEARAAGASGARLSAQPPRLPNTLGLDENRYAGFGDSITFGYVDFYPYPERGYIPRLNTILNTEYGSQRVINEGFGGEVTADGLVRIDKVFIADLARYILIMEGTNDVIFGDITIDSAAFNLREMVRKSLAAGAFPAIATILPRYDFYGTLKVFQDRILALNTRIRQIASDMAVPLVDMYTAYVTYPAGDGGVLSLLSEDLKHPSDKGYQFMAETWFAAIKAYPFPPADLSVTARRPERTSRSQVGPRQLGQPLTPQGASAATRQPTGYLLTWANSPKIFDASRILGYRIYRKASANPAAGFQLLAFVSQPLEYFDENAAVVNPYDYALATVRTDGLEGPVSGTVR